MRKKQIILFISFLAGSLLWAAIYLFYILK
ncbi:hypothetical protein ABID53_000491 [Bacillus oleivorans]